VQIEFLRGLAQIVEQEKLSELSVESAGVRLTLRTTPVPIAGAPTGHWFAHGGVAHGAAPFASMNTVEAADAGNAGLESPVSAGSGMADDAATQANLVPIEAPMVGVFYRAPSPNDPNFVEVGDRVEVGQTVGLVEAMKVFNEITSEVEGIVTEIRVQSSELVETGGTLMLIRKA